jgi:hypothetical protein
MVSSIFFSIYAMGCLIILKSVEENIHIFDKYKDRNRYVNRYVLAALMCSLIMLWPITIPLGLYLKGK